MHFPGEPARTLQLITEDNVLMDKRLRRPFEPAGRGTLEFDYHYENSIPGFHQCATSAAVTMLKVSSRRHFPFNNWVNHWSGWCALCDTANRDLCNIGPRPHQLAATATEGSIPFDRSRPGYPGPPGRNGLDRERSHTENRDICGVRTYLFAW